jgi:hypothetical protein
LDLLWIASFLRACKDYLALYSPYYEACLVEVVRVVITNTVLGLGVGDQLELGCYNAWIFVQGSLTIVWTTPFKLDLWRTRLEVVYLVLANRLSTTLSKQIIGHILHYSPCGTYSSLIEVKYTLD